MKNKIETEDKGLPSGYRFLTIGEPIKKGDCFWSDSYNKWSKIIHPGDAPNGIKESVIRREEDNGTD